MRSIRVVAVAALVSFTVFASPAQAAPVTFTATMTADEEVPEKGPAGATGSGTLNINSENNEVCYTFVTQNLNEPITAGHIHKAPKGMAGDVVVNLNLTAGNLSGCTTGEAAQVQAVMADPAGHYVNLHSEAHPMGVLRGQLMSAITNPQAGVPQQEAQPAVPPQLSQTSPRSQAPASTSQLPRTGPGGAALLVGIALGLVSIGTGARAAGRRS